MKTTNARKKPSRPFSEQRGENPSKPRTSKASQGVRTPFRPPEEASRSFQKPSERKRQEKDDELLEITSSRVKHARPEPSSEMKGERLHKLLAQSGLGSRREMEALIAEGQVSVNGAIATLGMQAHPGDRVKVKGRLVSLHFANRAVRILMYHKPEGEIVTQKDPEHRPTVFANLPRLRVGRWIAVGRLDVNTSGLLLFTTSGELANHLMHPKHEITRDYAVRVLGELTDELRKTLLSGIELEDGFAQFQHLEKEGGEGANQWYHASLSEGRNREVRRLFEAIGLTVSRLMRVRYGPFVLPSWLKRGKSYEYTEEEVRKLFGVLGLPVSKKPRKVRD